MRRTAPAALAEALPRLLVTPLAHAAPTPRGPTAAIEAPRWGHPQRSEAAFESLLSGDFRFHFSAGESAGTTYAAGLNRASEMNVCHARFAGDPRAQMAPPGTVHVTLGALKDLDALTVSLSRIAGERGDDIAAPANGPAGDPVPSMPGLRVVDAPLCPTLKLLCDLPGTEPAHLEVDDVQGRWLASRTDAPSAAGTQLIEAGNGRRFTPGVHGVRLQQGKRPAAKRMVVVAM